MKAAQDEKERLEELLLRREDEELIPEETEELIQILHASRDARRSLAMHYLLDAGITRELGVLQSERTLVGPDRRRASAARWLALAAGLTLIFGGAWLFFRQPTGLGLRVTEVTGDVTVTRAGRTVAAGADLELREGDLVSAKTAGKASMMYDGEESRIDLEGATTASFRSENGAKRVNLAVGTLICTVAPQQAPFEIKTPNAVARVLGTRFTLEADAAATQIEVEDGLVRLTRSEDGASVDVPAGHKTAVSSGADLLVEPTRAPGLLLDLDFEDGIPPEGITGTVVEDPRMANSRLCVAGVWSDGDRVFRVNIRNGNRALLTYRDGAVLSFDYWVKEYTGAIDMYFWNETRSVSRGFVIRTPVQEQWTHVEKPLSECTDELRDGDLIWDLSIQTTRGGNELFVDNIRIETEDEP